MSAIAEFLNARLDEDEAEARATADADAEFWADVKGDGTHFARHDPARVLREVAAKRAILAQWQAMPPDSPVLTYALYQLAAVYSDHPDYRREWTS